mmetsp:Transcript_4683/g.11585  ORF Transcript_4683/g.11585 Transcript_4683/m.11585 type:complete len:267 (+) Transcript_4683:79-879(+)
MWRALVCLSAFSFGSAMQLRPRLASALVHAPRSPTPALTLEGDEPRLPLSGTKLDDFLVLMGRCYGVAGLAHAADFATGNALPAAAGLPPFALLPPVGQALGVVWVLVGILQPIASTRAAQQAGLIAYGAYEIILTLAAWTATSDPDGNLMRLGAAAGLQVFVGYCFVELRRQSIEAAATEAGARGGRSPPPRMMVGRPAPRPGRGGKGGSAERSVGGQSFQQKMEAKFGKDVFKYFVIATGVLCYPLMAYGVAMKAAARVAGVEM